MKFRAIAADSTDFSRDEAEALANTAVGCPVTANFDRRKPPIGRIDSASVDEDGRLIIEGELLSDCIDKAARIVPGYEIPDFISKEFGLTLTPVNKTLPPVESNAGIQRQQRS